MNYDIQINAISNYWWSFYYLFLAVRSTVLSAQYTEQYTTATSLYLTNWCVGGVEILLLCYALSYQNNYRSLSLVTQEIDEEIVGQEAERRGFLYTVRGTLRACKSSGIVLLVEFLCMVGAVVVFYWGHTWFPRYGVEVTAIAFWCYSGMMGLLHVTACAISVSIAWKHSYDGPYVKTKIFLVSAVVVNAMESFPMFVWMQCAGFPCYSDTITVFDVFVVCKLVSVLLIYYALHCEYYRLKTECQYLILTEVPGRTNQFPGSYVTS